MTDEEREARFYKLEGRVTALEKMAGELYGKTHANAKAITEVCGTPGIRPLISEPLWTSATTEFIAPIQGMGIELSAPQTIVFSGYEVEVSDSDTYAMREFKARINEVGHTPVSDVLTIHRVNIGSDQFLLVTQSGHVQVCLPGEETLRTTAQVRELLDAGKLDHAEYFRVLVDTVEKWYNANPVWA